jgi:uncharacterized protein (TIGR00251 family)
VTGADWLAASPGGVTLEVWAQPRASRTRAAGLHGDALKIQLAAPPVDGEANAELTAYLAKTLGVPKSAIEIVRGDTGRKKRVSVKGVTMEEVREKLLT